jgi:hypothetical protein
MDAIAELLSLKEIRHMPKARKLISGASFDADTLVILGMVFDEVWASVAPDLVMIRARLKVREFGWLQSSSSLQRIVSSAPLRL